MTSRERFIAALLHRDVDRGVLHEDRLWNETRARWVLEGMTEPFAYDFVEEDSMSALQIHFGFLPPFREEVLEEQGEYRIVVDAYGITKRVLKGATGMPQFLKFPVSDRASWAATAKRLADAPERMPAKRADSLNAQTDFPVTFGSGHLCGFFSFLRELCGEEVYYLLYDDPDLIKEMVSFQADRLIALMRRAIASGVTIDRQFIWEDMCYKGGPLIGPAMFREFLLPAYCKVIDCARGHGVPIVDVDSDGNISDLLPLWVEAGVNAMHPFEVASGMDVNEISRKYKMLGLRGGVDKRALARGRAAIDRELERIRPAFEAGGYIPHVDHSVPPDVSYADYQYYLDQLRALLG